MTKTDSGLALGWLERCLSADPLSEPERFEIERVIEALRATPAAGGEIVAWRWRPHGSINWIYNPASEWRELQRYNDGLEMQPLYAVQPASPLRGREPTTQTGTVHTLKTWPRYFGDVLSGLKPFEWRIDDRSFSVGDLLILQEWEPLRENLGCKEGRYTGREIRKLVTYIFSPFATNKRTVVMGFSASPPEQPAVAWQPIETAPKDRSWVLVWEAEINQKYHPAEVARFVNNRWESSAMKYVNATHWMPLPAAPNKKAQA